MPYTHCENPFLIENNCKHVFPLRNQGKKGKIKRIKSQQKFLSWNELKWVGLLKCC